MAHVFLLSWWLNDWLNEIRYERSYTVLHPSCARAHTLSFPPVLARCVSACGSSVAKIISRYLQAWTCMNAPFPSFHTMMCFLFCVCFDPSLAAELLCGEVRVRVALPCYFWQQRWLVAVEERGDRSEGGGGWDSMKPETEAV